MKVAKIAINPEKEYEALRLEIIKRLEFQQSILNIKLTIVAAFFGFGLNNKNNLLILVIPPFVLLFAIIWKSNNYYRTKVSCYMDKKFETGDLLSTATHNYWQRKGIKWSEGFLSLGVTGLYLILPSIALFIGIVNTDHSLVETVLLFIDCLSIVLIAFIFIFFNTVRMRRQFFAQLDALLAAKASQSPKNTAPVKT